MIQNIKNQFISKDIFILYFTKVFIYFENCISNKNKILILQEWDFNP